MIDPQFHQVLSRSGLTRIELAQLYDVSRQTIHYWRVTGPPREGSLTARMVAVITKALLEAMRKGLLPMPALDKRARKARVASMAAKLQSLKPAPK